MLPLPSSHNANILSGQHTSDADCAARSVAAWSFAQHGWNETSLTSMRDRTMHGITIEAQLKDQRK